MSKHLPKEVVKFLIDNPEEVEKLQWHIKRLDEARVRREPHAARLAAVAARLDAGQRLALGVDDNGNSLKRGPERARRLPW